MPAPVSFPTDTLYRLHGAEISYFTAKIRPALRRKAVHFVEVLPDYQGVIVPRTGLGFIPIVVTPEDEVWQDTSTILDRLEERFPDPPLIPATPLQRVVALLLELYADEFLLLPAMHYRWSFPESATKARADFLAFTGDPERSLRFADRMQGSLPFLGVTPETSPAIEAHTRDVLDVLSTHLQATPYLLGERMSLADCALMGPLYGHLYQDAVPAALLRETAPRVCHWIERMNRPDPSVTGSWLPDDALAPTLEPLLALIGRDAVPLLLDTVRAFEAWADARPADAEIPPRSVGGHESALRGVACQRYTSSYTLWMVQRPLDAYRACDADARARVDRALAGTGCEPLLAYSPRHRLGKRGDALAFEAPAAA